MRRKKKSFQVRFPAFFTSCHFKNNVLHCSAAPLHAEIAGSTNKIFKVKMRQNGSTSLSRLKKKVEAEYSREIIIQKAKNCFTMIDCQNSVKKIFQSKYRLQIFLVV